MVRRTKQEAQETRQALIDAAEVVFDRHGVAGTSLQDVADAAGLTRGAVYWHFRDKSDLVNAMMERAIVPFERAWFALEADATKAPLERLNDRLCDVLRLVATDDRLRRVLGISTLKMEYVGEDDAIRAYHLQIRERALQRIESMLRQAVPEGPLAGAMTPKAGAQALHALVNGLIENWMLDPKAFDLCRVGHPAVALLIAGLTGGSATMPASSGGA